MYVSLCSHMMCCESSWRLMEEKKTLQALRHIDSVISAVAFSFMHLFSCLCLQYCNALSKESCLSSVCRRGSGKIKRLKSMPISVGKQGLFYSSFFLSSFLWSFQSGHGTLNRMKERSLEEQSYCGLNLIKGRSAFKCLLFPWAKRLWASQLLPAHPAQTPPPLDAINIERIPRPALLSYNNSVRTKVNALNLISVLVIFDGVAMQAKGGRNVKGGIRARERLVVCRGLGWKQN